MLDIDYMRMALEEARLAFDEDEVPIGCLIVKGDEVIARAHNTVEKDKLAISHAEINAIKLASKNLGDWRLDDCVMYVTKEPCAMCAGAISKARIKRLVIGTRDLKMGCAGSLFDILNDANMYHKVDVTFDLLAEECLNILQDFFKKKRKVVE
ncbi:MAG: nucleoside deaminase [Tissierellia bacterium]|nr:nucleoside deaminase [Tissierellia bacterium]